MNAPGSDLGGACPDCGAGGLDSNGQTCPACHGTGQAHPRHDFDH
ncbi:hypothetical protein [Thermomonospora amylolytica]|nr:hypothetical protein [Thermomonospora amylolytica]